VQEPESTALEILSSSDKRLSKTMLTTWIELSTSLGLVAAVGWVARWYWHRRRWRRFERAIREWALNEQWLPEELSDDQWKSLVVIKLSEAEFSPAEIKELLELAVLVAKGCTSLEVRGRM
jgi:hypothetical protein